MKNKKIVKAFIEIPKGSSYKYEYDFDIGRLVVDRPLPEPLPYNYGFVPGTMYKDGDPLDICVVGDSIVPTCLVEVEILGAFICDDNGDGDDKIIGKVIGDNTYDHLFDWNAIIRRYLETYKEGFKVISFVGAEDALKIVEESLT